MKAKVTPFLLPLIVLFSSLSLIDPLNAGSLSPPPLQLTGTAVTAAGSRSSNPTSASLANDAEQEAPLHDQAVKESLETNAVDEDDRAKDHKGLDEAAAAKGMPESDNTASSGNHTEVKSDNLPPCPWFTCGNGRCLIDTWRCDQQDDCGDNTDEMGCENMICAPEMFRCSSGMCITKSWLCDSFKDCPAGDDENDC